MRQPKQMHPTLSGRVPTWAVQVQGFLASFRRVIHVAPLPWVERAVALREVANSRGLHQVAVDWRLGRQYGYPRCCIAHFCWDQLWDNLPRMPVVGNSAMRTRPMVHRWFAESSTPGRPRWACGFGLGALLATSSSCCCRGAGDTVPQQRHRRPPHRAVRNRKAPITGRRQRHRRVGCSVGKTSVSGKCALALRAEPAGFLPVTRIRESNLHPDLHRPSAKLVDDW